MHMPMICDFGSYLLLEGSYQNNLVMSDTLNPLKLWKKIKMLKCMWVGSLHFVKDKQESSTHQMFKICDLFWYQKYWMYRIGRQFYIGSGGSDYEIIQFKMESQILLYYSRYDTLFMICISIG